MVKQSLLIKGKVIICDYREKKSEVIKHLKRYIDLILLEKNLPIGDYIVNNIIIERKNINDFLNSIVDGRIFDQVKRMKEEYDKIIIILEGSIYNLLEEELKRIYTTIAELINYNINVIHSLNPYYTAHFLYKLSSSNFYPSIPIGKKSHDKYEIAIRMLTSLPGIGIKKAKEILYYFKSIKNFVNADVKDLIKLKIGSKRAKEIKEILEYEFKNSNSRN